MSPHLSPGEVFWGIAFFTIALGALLTALARKCRRLRASEFHYRQLFQANPHPMWFFDLKTLAFLDVNDAAVAHYGYSREEFLQMTIKEIRPPEEVPELLADISRATDGVDQFATRHRCRDGRVIEVELTAHNMELGGRPARVVLVHDATAKRRAEARMRLDAAALMSTGDAVMIADRTPCVRSVNPAFTEMTGYREEEILGQDPHVVIQNRDNAPFARELISILSRQGHWQGEVWGRRKNGETFPVRLALSIVPGPGGEPEHFVGVMTDLTQLRRSEERLEYLANHDLLTGLPNRQLLESILQHALAQEHRKGSRLGVLIVNLDQFKAVNDSFGHQLGDQLLVAVVERLKKRVRGGETLARLAGDKFALVLPGLEDYADAEVVARDLHAALDPPFFLGDDCRIMVRASIGISVYPQDGATAPELLRGADAAVNLAKENGGSQSCFFTAELNTQARLVLELQGALQQALERQEFVLYYQPKVDLRSGRMVGAEALLRWERPGHGLVPPLQFIPALEKTGLIVQAGAWVIEEVCRQMREWRDAGLPEISIAVNVSARQFRIGHLEEIVRTALVIHALDPRHLTLELTESMLMDEPEKVVGRMSELKRLGVRLALDDFGTGYSSLGYLSRFPIDQLKIDRSFIIGITVDPDAATIANSIIALAHRMRLTVVAEGVETEAQLAYLRANGCDEIQGYYFSRPLPADALAELVREEKGLALPEKS